MKSLALVVLVSVYGSLSIVIQWLIQELRRGKHRSNDT